MTTLFTKSIISWDTCCSLLAWLTSLPKGVGSTFRNVGELPSHTTSHSGRSLWESQAQLCPYLWSWTRNLSQSCTTYRRRDWAVHAFVSPVGLALAATFQSRIRNVLSLNLGQYAGYPDWDFVIFFVFMRQMPDRTFTGPRLLLYKPIPVHWQSRFFWTLYSQDTDSFVTEPASDSWCFVLWRTYSLLVRLCRASVPPADTGNKLYQAPINYFLTYSFPVIVLIRFLFESMEPVELRKGR